MRSAAFTPLTMTRRYLRQIERHAEYLGERGEPYTGYMVDLIADIRKPGGLSREREAVIRRDVAHPSWGWSVEGNYVTKLVRELDAQRQQAAERGA